MTIYFFCVLVTVYFFINFLTIFLGLSFYQVYSLPLINSLFTWRVVQPDNVLDVVDKDGDFRHHGAGHHSDHRSSHAEGLQHSHIFGQIHKAWWSITVHPYKLIKSYTQLQGRGGSTGPWEESQEDKSQTPSQAPGKKVRRINHKHLHRPLGRKSGG